MGGGRNASPSQFLSENFRDVSPQTALGLNRTSSSFSIGEGSIRLANGWGLREVKFQLLCLLAVGLEASHLI